jgi:hypothetical protein
MAQCPHCQNALPAGEVSHCPNCGGDVGLAPGSATATRRADSPPAPGAPVRRRRRSAGASIGRASRTSTDGRVAPRWRRPSSR